MPRSRQPREIWLETRQRIWTRDGGRCKRCDEVISLEDCHIDHVKSGKLGSNNDNNLRTLCRKCHVLRADKRHRGMTSAALRDGIIPPDWRKHVWYD